VATKTQPMITRLSACSAGYIFRLLLFSNQTGSAVGCVPETRKKKTGVNLISIARKEVRHVASRPTTTHIRYIVTSYPAAAAAGPFFSPRLFISLSSSPREFPLYLCRRWCH
jgi:hypothetical protein